MPRLQETVSGEESRSEWQSHAATGGVAAEAVVQGAAATGPVTIPSPLVTPRPIQNIPISLEPSAADRHVRPDELRAALSAIEARRGAAVVETVPLGQALGQDQAEVTPDEVWQEIYAQRNRARASAMVEEQEKRRRRKRILQTVSGVTCLITTAIAIRLLVGDMGQAASAESSRVPLQPPPGIGLTGPAATSGNPTATAMQAPTVSQALTPPTEASQGINGQASDLKGSGWNGTNRGETVPGGSGRVGQTGQTTGNTAPIWQITAQGGHNYLRCWADLPDGVSPNLYTNSFTVYNRPDHMEAAGKSLRPLTVPLDVVTDLGGVENGGYARRQIRLNMGNNRSNRSASAPTNTLPPAAPSAATSGGTTGETTGETTGGEPRTRAVQDRRGGTNRTGLGERRLPSGETLKEVSPGKYILEPP